MTTRTIDARRTAAACMTLIALALGGCAVTPTSITDEEVRSRVQADQFRIYAAQEPVYAPINFNEALARSLKYNLDYRLKLMESALAVGLADVARYDMLPNLLATAGYTSRNNLSGSRSFDIIDDKAVDRTPAAYSGGQDKRRSLASAEFSWSILDFGVGYFRAKQKANEVLIAEERRRRVVQNILSDVRSAYWRAVGAQRLVRQADQLTVRVRTALERSREAEALGLLPTKESLAYQRLLLDAVTLLASRRQELDFAKRELAALMNVTPGTDFTVAEIDEQPLMPPPINVAQLEEVALLNRPELRQEDYQVRITAAEARKQLLYLLPNLGISSSGQYDSNSYLYNKSWLEAGSRVSFNLIRALAIPDTLRAQDAQVKTDDMRRMALSMAILTQVRVAIERYKLALNEFEVARESSQVDQRMAVFARASRSSNIDSELEVIRAETRAINSEFQRNAAYAATQAAFGKIYNAVGLEVLPENMEDAPLRELGDKLALHIAHVESESFATMIVTEAPLPPILVRFQGIDQVEFPPPGPSDRLKLAYDISGTERAPKERFVPPDGLDATIVSAANRALERNQITIAGNSNAHRVDMKLRVDTMSRNGIRRCQWLIRLISPQGRTLGEAAYTSTLAATPSSGSLAAFAEAAVVANLRNIKSWLQPGD